MMATAALALIVGVIILVVGMNSLDDYPTVIVVGFLIIILGILLMLNVQHDDPQPIEELGIERVNSNP